MNFNLLLILFLCLSCNKLEKISNRNRQKDTLLIAKQGFADFRKINRIFTVFSDSSYVFKEIITETNYSKEENFEGKLKIKNDTLKFSPFKLDYNEAKTIVLKNGFIEFVDGEEPYRMKIEKTSLKVNNLIDFKKFKDYAVFTDYKKFETDKSNKSFDLTTNDLMRIETILKNEFQKNNRLRKYSDYLKQITSIKNQKNENIINIHCYCKEDNLLDGFQFYQTDMMDGGNCNVYIQLNLTSGKIEILNIAVMA